VLAESPPPGLLPVRDVVHLYRLTESMPRAWVVPQGRVIPGPDELLSELIADSFDPTAVVLLESGPNSSQLGDLDPASEVTSVEPQPLPGTISLREEWNSRTIDLVMSQPGYLVLAYTYYPGWRATVDGRLTEILRANYAFMALPLEPGEHQVMLRYQPVSLVVGAVITGLSFLVVSGTAGLRIIWNLRIEANGRR